MATESSAHIETNEDGKKLQHPGYVEGKCLLCGRTNLHAKSYPRRSDECIGKHRSKDAA